MRDSRQGLNKQFMLADLLRQSVYSRWAGYEDLNDAERLAADPTFRLISSQKIWGRGAALTSTLHWFETELLRFYNRRGTAGQWIKEGKQAAPGTRLSCHRFWANEAR